MKPVRILSSDLLICDRILSPAEHAPLAPLIADYNRAHPQHPVVAGSKSPLQADEYARMLPLIAGKGRMVAGGSAANTLSTLKQLMGEALCVHLMAAYGEDEAGRVIAEALAQDGFVLWPQAEPFADVETATSLVLVHEGGERSILGYAGTSRQKILEHRACTMLPSDYDILFLPGSLWQKYGADFAQSLLHSRVEEGKKLWLSLPTHSQSAAAFDPQIREAARQAQVVLANAQELMRLYGANTLPEALSALQAALHSQAVGFITDGQRGAAVVTAVGCVAIAPEPIASIAIKNTLGAGDAAFAGFLFGVLRGMEQATAARLAMRLAAEKLRYASARIPNLAQLKNILDFSTGFDITDPHTT